MAEPDQTKDRAVRERAYFLWEREGRPEGRANDHWQRAVREARDRDDAHMDDEEKILDGHPNANLPAMLTKDVPGG